MPSCGKHLRNAERHYNAAVVAAERQETRSWAAVALFYSAHQLVHAVLDGETVLALGMRHPETHGGEEGTSTLVSKLYRPIAIAYKSLFGAGLAVRYAGQAVTEADLRGYFDVDYAVIREWAVKKLRDQGRQIPEGFLTI
jgi:hypothetical protein